MSQSSYKRLKHGQIHYTPRDIQCLYALFGIKYMTTTQIFDLFWRDVYSDPMIALKACQRRLRQLEKYQLIRRIKQATIPGTGSKPDIFKLAAGSIPLLEYECGVDPKLIDVEVWADEELNPKLKHILATTDVHIKFHQACQHTGYALEEWIDESALRSSPTKDMVTIARPDGAETQLVIIPDAFFILSITGKRGIYRLEVDRATVELEASREHKRSIAQKIKRYILFKESELYRECYGGRRLQVLYVVKGERRKANMMNVAGKVIKQFVKLPDEVPTDEGQRHEYERKLAECKRLNSYFHND
jgi:hypothetical protein